VHNLSIHNHDGVYDASGSANEALESAKSYTDEKIAAIPKADAYTKAEVDAKVASVYKFKGSVETFADLPSEGNVEGDVYNVKATGENYAWVAPAGEVAGHWDDLGGDVDLTAYATKEEVAATYETKADASATKTELLEEIARVEQAAAEGAAGAVHKMVAVNNELTPAGGKVVWEVAHNYGADVEVTIKEVATGAEVVADVIQGSNLLTIKMNSEEVVPANTYRVIIMGVAFEPMSEESM
jgi:hypothetical protein